MEVAETPVEMAHLFAGRARYWRALAATQRAPDAARSLEHARYFEEQVRRIADRFIAEGPGESRTTLP